MRHARLLSACLYLGATLMLLSLVLYVSPLQQWVPVGYFVGASLYVFARQAARSRGGTTTMRRLGSLQLIGHVLMVLTAVPLAMQVWHWGLPLQGVWVLCLTIAAWMELYTVFRMAREERREP